jgi:hypothetical protein
MGIYIVLEVVDFKRDLSEFFDLRANLLRIFLVLRTSIRHCMSSCRLFSSAGSLYIATFLPFFIDLQMIHYGLMPSPVVFLYHYPGTERIVIA